ncbi:hypothetical protein BpHYR1_019203 [Brachionus plicatilis]|uniref:Uncharacterized protein n=1 Tax=Brachionus plicatilis TaxID=10195 RepID=A0A3M7RE49_BRAPC|nr:hypothetical protein BpHYR1_019203 [Brachionus plicatilis]
MVGRVMASFRDFTSISLNIIESFGCRGQKVLYEILVHISCTKSHSHTLSHLKWIKNLQLVVLLALLQVVDHCIGIMRARQARPELIVAV